MLRETNKSDMLNSTADVVSEKPLNSVFYLIIYSVDMSSSEHLLELLEA